MPGIQRNRAFRDVHVLGAGGVVILQGQRRATHGEGDCRGCLSRGLADLEDGIHQRISGRTVKPTRNRPVVGEKIQVRGRDGRFDTGRSVCQGGSCGSPGILSKHETVAQGITQCRRHVVRDGDRGTGSHDHIHPVIAVSGSVLHHGTVGRAGVAPEIVVQEHVGVRRRVSNGIVEAGGPGIVVRGGEDRIMTVGQGHRSVGGGAHREGELGLGCSRFIGKSPEVHRHREVCCRGRAARKGDRPGNAHLHGCGRGNQTTGIGGHGRKGMGASPEVGDRAGIRAVGECSQRCGCIVEGHACDAA